MEVKLKTLEEVTQFAFDHHKELEAEGINSSLYWSARMGVEDEEFTTYCCVNAVGVISEFMNRGHTLEEAASIAFMTAVQIGFIHGTQFDSVVEDE